MRIDYLLLLGAVILLPCCTLYGQVATNNATTNNILTNKLTTIKYTRVNLRDPSYRAIYTATERADRQTAWATWWSTRYGDAIPTNKLTPNVLGATTIRGNIPATNNISTNNLPLSLIAPRAITAITNSIQATPIIPQ